MLVNTRFRRCPEPRAGYVLLGDFKFPKEFACKCGCGECDIDYLVWLLCQLIRQRFNLPVIIRSGCRCLLHNQNVGGASDSDHRFGWAADVAVPGVFSMQVAEFLQTLPEVQRVGLYEPGGANGESGFVHIGVRDRGPGSWKRWRFDAQRKLIEAS